MKGSYLGPRFHHDSVEAFLHALPPYPAVQSPEDSFSEIIYS